jgi:restriction endonuclease S subunit
MSYTISATLNKNKVFILQKSELEKRLDPFYYVPEILELERKVLAKQPKKLRDYVIKVSSGATPKKEEEEKYYADKENGIPFLRVQNLSPTGVLEFEDCKYINEETHNGMLKRSQVSAGDLLVKITGVGRMAIASVVPDNFIGNINQHVCVIKTGSKEISETIAAFLNSDIGERLASRRSGGGTRPSLNYPALLSIPIIEDKRILQIVKKVTEQKQKNEAAAEKLLASIDDYLLRALGIDLPIPPENTLQSRMFTTSISELSGNRFDPFYNNQEFKMFFESLKKCKYPIKRFKEIAQIGNGAIINTSDYTNEGIPLIRIQNVLSTGIDFEDVKYVSEKTFINQFSSQIVSGELLFGMSGTIGRVAIAQDDLPKCLLNQRIAKVKIINDNSNVFIQAILNSPIGTKQFKKIGTGGIQINIGINDIENLKIPIPPLSKQQEIAAHITAIRQQVQQLKDQTKLALAQANVAIEEILLG